MTPFASILAATDFSIDGNNAVRRAALLAHEYKARLKLVHVIDPSGGKPLRDWFAPSVDTDLKAAQARDSLRRLAVEIAGRYGVTAAVEVVVGEPLEILTRASEPEQLLVLGRRGHNRLKALVVGRTVERLLKSRRHPVLVVRTPVDAAYRRVLVAVDFTTLAGAVVQVAARLAQDGSMQVFHAINAHRDAVLRSADVPEHVIRESRQRQAAGIIARLRRKVARLGLDSTQMGFAVARGHPVWSTLGQARRFGADLIVAGRQGRSTVLEFVLGSVSQRLLDASGCDMLIVPQPCRESSTQSTAPARLTARAPRRAALGRHAAATADAVPTVPWLATAEGRAPRSVA